MASGESWMDLLVWAEFAAAIAILMLLSGRSLWVALLASAIFLGLLGTDILTLSGDMTEVVLDPSILLLAISVALTAMIGGALEASGLTKDLLENARMRRKPLLISIPFLLGMIQIPGGALLSAPVVQKAAGDIPPARKAAINIWARHVSLLVYPLGTMLAFAKMAGLNVYVVLLYLFPWLLLTLVLIWSVLMRGIRNTFVFRGRRELKKMLPPVIGILMAPVMHGVLMNAFPSVMPEIFLIVSISCSLAFIAVMGKLGARDLLRVGRKMEAWDYFLIIYGLFIFLSVFKSTKVPGEISAIPMPSAFLVVGVAGFLGVVTGRVNVPMSVVIPIYIGRFGSMGYLAFSLAIFSSMIGFLLSPPHPCVSLTLKYFGATFGDFVKRTWLPAAICWALALIAALILI